MTHHGEFYHFDDVTIEPKPRKGSLDIWIGGKSDAVLKRVVRLGDGWFPALTSPPEFSADMAKLVAFGEEYGRKDEAGVLLLTHVSENRKEAWQAVAPSLQGLKMPEAEVAARCLVGPPEEYIATIQKFIEAGWTKFVLRPSCPPEQILEQIGLNSMGKTILPHFN